MAARAIWKGILSFEDIEVPVKLYSAVEDRNVRFRLLHGKDKEPVRQTLINPDSGKTVPYDQTRRAFEADDGARVLLSHDELDAIKPEKSRAIELLSFLPPGSIDHRWYDRPYYLGPDNELPIYRAFTEALRKSDRQGLVRWVMRNKEYYGAIRMYENYPMLMSLRYQAEVVSVEELQAPRGKPLDKKELTMARQLIGMLESEFQPEAYQDEYRQRVLELIESKKKKGGRIRRAPRKERKRSDDVSAALEASLKGLKKE